jgi:hypothetical protein
MQNPVLTDDLRLSKVRPAHGYLYPSCTGARRSWGISVGRTSFEFTVLAVTSTPPRELDATTTLTITAGR